MDDDLIGVVMGFLNTVQFAMFRNVSKWWRERCKYSSAVTHGWSNGGKIMVFDRDLIEGGIWNHQLDIVTFIGCRTVKIMADLKNMKYYEHRQQSIEAVVCQSETLIIAPKALITTVDAIKGSKLPNLKNVIIMQHDFSYLQLRDNVCDAVNILISKVDDILIKFVNLQFTKNKTIFLKFSEQHSNARIIVTNPTLNAANPFFAVTSDNWIAYDTECPITSVALLIVTQPIIAESPITESPIPIADIADGQIVMPFENNRNNWFDEHWFAKELRVFNINLETLNYLKVWGGWQVLGYNNNTEKAMIHVNASQFDATASDFSITLLSMLDQAPSSECNIYIHFNSQIRNTHELKPILDAFDTIVKKFKNGNFHETAKGVLAASLLIYEIKPIIIKAPIIELLPFISGSHLRGTPYIPDTPESSESEYVESIANTAEYYKMRFTHEPVFMQSSYSPYSYEKDDTLLPKSNYKSTTNHILCPKQIDYDYRNVKSVSIVNHEVTWNNKVVKDERTIDRANILETIKFQVQALIDKGKNVRKKECLVLGDYWSDDKLCFPVINY